MVVPETDPVQVSVASYNLYLGADLGLVLGDRPAEELAANLTEVGRQLRATAFPRRAGPLARSLVERRVDLVGLQEVCCWTVADDVMWDFAALLLAALREAGAAYETVSEVATFAGEGELAAGGSPLRLRIRGSNMVLRRIDSQVQVTEQDCGLFDTALDVRSLGEQGAAIARGWCGVRAEVGGRPFAFVNTHTEAYDEGSRDRQRDELMTVCDRWGPDPLVLVGDFNATPDRIGMPPGFVDAWSVNGGEAGPTCCQEPDLANERSRLDQRIDYVWVRDARVRSADRLGADAATRQAAGLWPSDHAGVHAVVELD